MILLALLLQAAVPEVPPQVQIIAEGREYVMRTYTDSPDDAAMSLYTYDRDAPGKSNCVDRCAAEWPPLVAPDGAKPVGKWSVIARADGKQQWAYNDKPVYTFVRDEEATTTGDGMGGVWHLLPTTPR